MPESREEEGDEFLFEQNLGELKVEGHSFQVIGLYHPRHDGSKWQFTFKAPSFDV